MTATNFYLPVLGLPLAFDIAQINMPRVKIPSWSNTIKFSRNNNKGLRTKIHKSRLLKDPRASEIPTVCDFEIQIPGDIQDGFDADIIHAILFSMFFLRTASLYCPCYLTTSAIVESNEDNEFEVSSDFLPGMPRHFDEVTPLDLEETFWIERNLKTIIEFMEKPRFQNAMQALNAYQHIPQSNFALLVAWTGIEALFGISSELSFRLSYLLARYLSENSDAAQEYDRFRKSYEIRSKVAHGSSTKLSSLRDETRFVRSTLGRCLKKAIEQRNLPDERLILFS